MSANVTQSQNMNGSAAKATLAKEAVARRVDVAPEAAARKPSGYGLPCSKCHLYYPADVDVCPTCKHNQRVSPVVPKIPPKTAQTAADLVPDTAILEQEREEFLRQFKAQLREAHADALDTPEAVCKFDENHEAAPAKAEICGGCYEQLQERLDVYEAALRIELKDAAQIVYDAVWSDPSDPGKTYQNAASALLNEIRKRAGITALMGSFQPLSH
jgi:hypothetical protein